jgi:hypothetical protein
VRDWRPPAKRQINLFRAKLTASVHPSVRRCTPPLAAIIVPIRSPSVRTQIWMWSTREQKTRLLVILVGAVLLTFNIHVYYLNFRHITVNGRGDFFLYWSFGKFLEAHPFADLYDYSLLHPFEVSSGGGPGFYGPHLYPPLLAFLFVPLTRLDYVSAELAWCLGTLALYLWAAFGRAWRPYAVLATLLLPMTVNCMAAGQNGFLSAALLIGGFRLITRRPLVAGIVFGLLCYKPQLSVLVPVALVSARQRRALASAAATVALIVVATSITAGWSIWPLWLASLNENASQLIGPNPLTHLMPTVMAAVSLLGGSAALARLMQLAAASAAITAVWILFRGGIGPLPAAALLAGTFLVPPYAMAYDVPIVATAMVLVMEERHAARGSFDLIEVMVLGLAATMPALMSVRDLRIPMATISIALLFGLIVRRGLMQLNAPATARPIVIAFP